MSKKMFVRLLVGLAFLAAAVLFLLSELMPDTFGGFNLAWAGLIFSGVSGLAFLFSALGTKNSVTLKKLNLLLSAALLVVAVLCLVFALALPDNLVLPIILVVLAAVLVLGILITGGKNGTKGITTKSGIKTITNARRKRKSKNKTTKKISKLAKNARFLRIFPPFLANFLQLLQKRILCVFAYNREAPRPYRGAVPPFYLIFGI